LAVIVTNSLLVTFGAVKTTVVPIDFSSEPADTVQVMALLVISVFPHFRTTLNTILVPEVVVL
jgi:hypothetical protein